jgi:protein ImuA
MEPAFPARTVMADLRRRIAALEGRPEAGMRLDPVRTGSQQAGPAEGRPVPPGPQQSSPASNPTARLALPFGVPGLDRLFRAGGLPLGALHELTAQETRETGALAGFAAALAARQAAFRAGMVVWAADRHSPREGGRLYAPGLHALGLDPGRVLFVDAADPADVLWVLEEALAARGVAAVLGEIRGNPRALDLTATRRLALRARDRPVLGLILRIDAAAEASASATRWMVASGPAGTLGGFTEGVGRPVWRLDLTKNREGHLGRFELEWDHHDRRFARPAPHPVARPDPAADRPADSRRTGQVVAFGRAS